MYDESVNENEAGELIIPGRPTVNDTPDWKNGAVLEEYTREIVFFDITRASLRPGAELVMAPQGCVAATQGDGPSQEFLEAEQVLTEQNVDTILYIPCPTDEVQVKKGREAIRQELGELYRQYFQSKQGKEKKLWLITPNPDETTEIEKAFEQEIETFNAHNPHYHITFVRENGICDPIEIEVKT
ncbi:MAG: hypothetical protein LBP53_01880 [Candidatus Peribacteria bacterium]|nr:hypothetical protein [Candidatus Peribacteria bacterium]